MTVSELTDNAFLSHVAFRFAGRRKDGVYVYEYRSKRERHIVKGIERKRNPGRFVRE